MARSALASILLAASPLAAAAQDCPLTVTEPFQPPAIAAASLPRIRAIRFEGRRAVSAAALSRRMEMKPARFWRSRRRSVYSDEAWAADHRRLCDLYREHGHLTASVGPPVVVPVSAAPGGPAEVTLRIPVREGPQYRLEDLIIGGIPPGEADDVRAATGLRPGDVYRHDRLVAALDDARRAAGRRGQATWSAAITMDPRPAPKVAGVAVQIEEGPPWFVRRISFQGAPRTRDQTLRRAVTLDEGGLLDTEALAASTRQLDALGFVRGRDVKVEPTTGAEPRADVTFVLEQRPVLRYGLSGSVNALEGVSGAAELGTVNALGRGERLSGSVQIGQNVRAWEVAASVPYVFGTAWTAGLRAHAQRLEYEGVPDAGVPPYVRDADGFSLYGGRALGTRASLALEYSLADVELRADAAAPPAGFDTRREGRLSLSVGRDGWDHPWKPRRGLRVSGALRGWGGPLGGEVDALEARGRAFGFVPLGRRAALGAGAQGGLLRSPDGLAGLPFDDRYLLGGEDELRGFKPRSVGPLDASGNLVAGTAFVALHGEAHLDLPWGSRALGFVDAGNAWAGDPALEGGGLRVSTGLELRFELPVVHLPLRLIGAANPVRDPFHPRNSFRVVVGPLP